METQEQSPLYKALYYHAAQDRTKDEWRKMLESSLSQMGKQLAFPSPETGQVAAIMAMSPGVRRLLLSEAESAAFISYVSKALSAIADRMNETPLTYKIYESYECGTLEDGSVIF